MAKYNWSKFSELGGHIYYDDYRATPAQIKAYNKHIAEQEGIVKKVNTRSKRNFSIPSQYKRYFNSKLKFTGKGGTPAWAKPLGLRGGANPEAQWRTMMYQPFKGGAKHDITTVRWGAKLGKSNATVLNGTKQWVRQIQVTVHALSISAENWRIMVGQRAIKVFQNSFRYLKFYNNRSQHWQSLSSATLRKRAKRGTGSRILREYGDLYESIKLKERQNAMTTRVYTDIVPANSSKHKKHSVCYAGYHNEGKGTYGKGWRGHKPTPYVKRQFMGHSSYLNPITDPFMRKMMRTYLFDNVFLSRQVK
jgi:hypothetical protein